MSGMYNLPASPAARRKEIELRTRSIENRLDMLTSVSVEMGGAQASPTPAVVDPRITTLARAIGQDKILLPTAVIINRAWANDGSDEMIATSITFDRLTFTISEAFRLGILTPDGRFNHFRASTISHFTPRPGELMRPHHFAALPGRPSL
jgi:hypothetical protein